MSEPTDLFRSRCQDCGHGVGPACEDCIARWKQCTSARCLAVSVDNRQCRLLNLHPGDSHEWGIEGQEVFDPMHNRWLPPGGSFP